MSASEQTPLISASAVPDTSNDAVIARAIAHEFNSYEEFASEVRKVRPLPAAGTDVLRFAVVVVVCVLSRCLHLVLLV